jgi:predicted metalloprotease
MPVLDRFGRVLVSAALAVTLAGCALPAESGQPPAARRPLVTSQPLSEDERLAVTAVDAFWRTRFPQLFNATYTSPTVTGRYLGTSGPGCGGEPSTPFNAFYCSDGDFLAWDTNLMATGFNAIGDAWIYLIIAHEWGHAIQARLDRSLVSVAAELQADCLAGAAIQGAVDLKVIELQPGDNQELSKTLISVADKFAWTSTSDHGNATQRITFFNRGTRGGVPACI